MGRIEEQIEHNKWKQKQEAKEAARCVFIEFLSSCDRVYRDLSSFI